MGAIESGTTKIASESIGTDTGYHETLEKQFYYENRQTHHRILKQLISFPKLISLYYS